MINYKSLELMALLEVRYVIVETTFSSITTRHNVSKHTLHKVHLDYDHQTA